MILIDKEKFIEEVRKRKYSSASIKLIEDQPTVEAIPIGWIRNYVSIWVSEAYRNFVLNMITKWEKENEID